MPTHTDKEKYEKEKERMVATRMKMEKIRREMDGDFPIMPPSYEKSMNFPIK